MRRLLSSSLALALLGASACHPPEETKAEVAAPKVVEPPVKVTTAPVTVQKMPQYLTLTGSVAADRQSEVAANVAGKVLTTYVERGQAVKVGQPLAITDAKASSLSAAAASAQLKAAETQLAQAKNECDRADRLFKGGTMAQAEYDRARTACQAQVFAAEATKANADLATKMAGDAIIRAPIEGVIGERYINVGEYVQPPTRVASIYSISPVRVSLSVPESAVGLVKVGQPVEVKVEAYEGRTFTGTIKFVSPALRAQTRDLVVEAVVDNPDGALKAGMFATIRVVTGEQELPTVPASAIRAEGTIKRLFLAKDRSAVELVVQTGVEKDGRTAVLEKALANGAQVVVQPPPELHDGSALQ